jgi:serine protease Do
MRRIATLGLGFALLAAVFFTSQRIDVRLQVRENAAVARSLDRVFWTEGEQGAVEERPDSFADLAEELSPSVVNIQVERTAEPRTGPPGDLLEEFFGRRQHRPRRRFRSEASGSGFVISAEGYIVTNNHVVEGADTITVLFRDGEEKLAEVVGRDPKTDLALIKVEPGDSVVAAPLGDSDKIRVGDWLMAIGNPFGLEHTVTVGILSARERNIHAGPYDEFLQTDASINPGNSGGPLIDMKGRVIGINTAINAAGQGIGFAIPINMAKALLPQLRENGSVTRGWLGVSIQRVTKPIAKSLDLEEMRGALVSQVFDDSPAEQAKLKSRDVIVQFDGARIDDVDDLPRRVAATPPGSEVEIVVMRDGKRKTLKAKLETMKRDKVELASHEAPSFDWGFSVQNLDPELSEQLGMSAADRGVIVTDVDPDGAAGDAGLRRRDVIIEANRKQTPDLKSLEQALDQDEERALLLVRRGDGTMFVAIER